MKKTIILILSLIVIAILGWIANDLLSNKGKSDTELIEFAIEDIESVDRIIITDKFSNVFELVKKDNKWTDKDGNCVIQENVDYILETFQKITFKGYLPDNSLEKYNKLIAAQHIKVEIFQDGEWTKTWYLGPASQDHYGQIMLLDSDEYGKSDFPVLMKIKGHNGFIDARFFADPRQWACTRIMALELNEIKEVNVKFNDEPERSFSVERKGNSFEVRQQGELLDDVDTSMIFRYLNNFQKVHFNRKNFELNATQVDSVKNTTPFAILNVTETNNQKTQLKCYRIIRNVSTEDGIEQKIDVDLFWCQLPNGELVKCQYFVFNPILLAHVYFPLDVSMLKTADGIFEK